MMLADMPGISRKVKQVSAAISSLSLSPSTATKGGVCRSSSVGRQKNNMASNAFSRTSSSGSRISRRWGSRSRSRSRAPPQSFRFVTKRSSRRATPTKTKPPKLSPSSDSITEQSTTSSTGTNPGSQAISKTRGRPRQRSHSSDQPIEPTDLDHSQCDPNNTSAEPTGIDLLSAEGIVSFVSDVMSEHFQCVSTTEESSSAPSERMSLPDIFRKNFECSHSSADNSELTSEQPMSLADLLIKQSEAQALQQQNQSEEQSEQQNEPPMNLLNILMTQMGLQLPSNPSGSSRPIISGVSASN